jgi:hypothetical protein
MGRAAARFGIRFTVIFGSAMIAVGLVIAQSGGRAWDRRFCAGSDRALACRRRALRSISRLFAFCIDDEAQG